METLPSTFPLFTANPNLYKVLNKSSKQISTRVSIKPPPPEFDFRTEISTQSRATIAKIHPELLDLADNGTLVLVGKRQFGPVPSWRTKFVEPEVIWLVGTSHISSESVKDVERVVRAVKPDNLVVELCRSRAGIMYASNDGELGQQLGSKSNVFSLSGSGFFGAVGRSINLGGQTALALRLLLALFSSKISSDVNRPFGDEFRAARKASEEVGAQIVLGDRPIEITLERAWNSLKWKEKLSLVISVVHGITSSSVSMNNLKVLNSVPVNCKIVVMTYVAANCIRKEYDKPRNACNIKVDRDFQLQESVADDSTSQLYKQLSFSYPSLLQPLIHERDTYLAWSLKRSKAVNNGKRVVGVIGKGHMNGVIYALVSDLGDLRFRDLVGERTSSGDGSNGWINTLIKNLVRDTIIGIVLWAFYEQVLKSV